MQFANKPCGRFVERDHSAAARMQKRRVGGLDRAERDLGRDSESVEIRFENSFAGKESRLDSRCADRASRVGAITQRSQMRMLGCEIAVHAEGLADFEGVKATRLAIQIETKRGHQSRQE